MIAALPLLLAAASPQAIAVADPQPPATPTEAAPEAPEPQAQATSGQGGDIVITARRREERLQDVPIAIAVTARC
jgi:iron complex outermembrane recepter protein